MRFAREEPSRNTVDTERPTGFVLRLYRGARHHRVTGHAAEMAFFAVLTLVPSTVAVGAALGLSKQVLGGGVVDEAENAMVGAVRTLMGPDLADTVIAPFVHAQLSQPRGGVAIGGLLIAWWLSSHLFASTGHALDTIYGIERGRGTVIHRGLSLAFALVSVVLVAVTVEAMVVGPLGGADSGIVASLGMGDVYATTWAVVRWPLLLTIVVAFLVSLYRWAPNARHCWRDCLPGAVFGAALWILAAVLFRVSAALGLSGSSGVAAADPTVNIIGQSVNAVVATVLWAYFASIAILLGGELNAALRERRAQAPAEPPVVVPAAYDTELVTPGR